MFAREAVILYIFPVCLFTSTIHRFATASNRKMHHLTVKLVATFFTRAQIYEVESHKSRKI